MSGAEFMALVKKNPISVGCGGLAILLVAGIYFRGGKIPDAEATLLLKTAEAERHASNLKNAVQLQQHVDALVVANKEIDSRIIVAAQRGLNLQFFNKLAAETGVKSLTYQQSSLAPAKAGKAIYNPIGFSVAVSGTPAQLLDYVQHLESGERYCRVLTASLATVGGNRAGPLTLTLNLELLGRP